MKHYNTNIADIQQFFINLSIIVYRNLLLTPVLKFDSIKPLLRGLQMSNHTKGNWEIEVWHKLLSDGSCGEQVVQVSAFEADGNRSLALQISGACKEEEVDANASLISAAPDLLKALEAMYKKFSNGEDNFALAVINKAKGIQ